MVHHSRRSFLKTGAGVAGLCLVEPCAFADGLPNSIHEPQPDRLMPFPLASVRLAPGIFKEQEEINARYLDSLAVDRLLYSFRATVGVSSSATPAVSPTHSCSWLVVEAASLSLGTPERSRIPS